MRAAVISFLKKIYCKVRPVLRKILPFSGFERFLFPAAGQWGLTTIINLVLGILLLPVELTAYLQKRLVPQKGDLLLLLDSSWVYPIWPAVRRAKRNGAIVGLVLYDIIQVTHPQLFTPVVVGRFQKWFEQSIDNVDFYIAISKTVRDQIEAYVASNHPSANRTGRFESFQLGSVIDNVVSSGKVRDELRRVFKINTKSDTYLSVGTIEPRKNYKYLMDSFEKVWEEYPDARLCVVGRTSWLCEQLPKRIKSHPKYGKCLFMFNNASDTELDYCYSHAKALVLPSQAEGFGLPLVEALYKRLPVLASDIPIFWEVGKEFCAYFDISQPASLAKMIVDIEKEQRMPEVRNPEEYQLLDWKDSCRELLYKAVTLYEKVLV